MHSGVYVFCFYCDEQRCTYISQIDDGELAPLENDDLSAYDEEQKVRTVYALYMNK